MGVVTNTAKTAIGSSQPLGAGQSSLVLNATQTLGGNMASNLGAGSACPILNESMGLAQGIAQGDFKQAAVNAGLLGAYSLPLGGAQKLAANASYGSLAAGSAFAMGAARAECTDKPSSTNEQNQDNVDQQNNVNLQ
jgi:hypothetical protein